MIHTRTFRAICFVVLFVFFVGPSFLFAQEGGAEQGSGVRVRLGDGSVVVAQRVESGDGSADYFVSSATGSWEDKTNESDVSSGGDFVPESTFEWYLFIFGLLAQATFMSRFFVQWLVSERAKKSVIPRAFWWLSLAGSTMLFTYFTLRHDPIGMLGQCTGWLIYSRNLYFIYRPHRGS